MIKRYKNGYSNTIGIKRETCQEVLMIFKFHFERGSRSRANFCKFTQVCWRGVALYAAMSLCSLHKFVRCGPLVTVACRLVIQGICLKEADLSVAPIKFMQLHGEHMSNY
jgi:hypothetical protein